MIIDDRRISDTYQSCTRNKLIAEAFYLTNNIEKYGSGYIRIREEMKVYPTDLGRGGGIPVPALPAIVRQAGPHRNVAGVGA